MQIKSVTYKKYKLITLSNKWKLEKKFLKNQIYIYSKGWIAQHDLHKGFCLNKAFPGSVLVQLAIYTHKFVSDNNWTETRPTFWSLVCFLGMSQNKKWQKAILLIELPCNFHFISLFYILYHPASPPLAEEIGNTNNNFYFYFLGWGGGRGGKRERE